MRVRQFLLIGAALSLIAGCDSQDVLAPPAGYSNAAVSRSCGPADGPAVAIYLAPVAIDTLEPAAPYIRIYLWRPVDAVLGSWLLAPSSADGTAARYQSSPGSIETATGGNVVVLSVGADSTITGNVDLQFPSTGRVRGGFRARWISRTFLCG